MNEKKCKICLHRDTMALVLILQSLLSIFQILDEFNVPIYPTIHRVTSVVNFTIPLNVAVFLQAFLILWLISFVVRRYYYLAIIPLLFLLLHIILGLNSMLSIGLLLLVYFNLIRNNLIPTLFKWILIIFSISYLISIIFMSFVPWLNKIEIISSIIYFESYFFYLLSNLR